jgi:hypothetical protein
MTFFLIFQGKKQMPYKLSGQYKQSLAFIKQKLRTASRLGVFRKAGYLSLPQEILTL